MIVDGICVQFFGYFYCDVKHQSSSEKKSAQISGVGRVELDENYYRELSSSQIKTVETNMKNEQETFVGPVLTTMIRSQKAKTKERKTSQNAVIKSQTTTTRSTTEENVSRTTTNSPPLTSSRSHSHVHKPYPPRSPRSLNKPLVNSGKITNECRTNRIFKCLDSNSKETKNVVSSLPESSSSFPSHFSSVLNTTSFSTSTNIPTPIPVFINPTAPVVPFQRFINPMALPQPTGVPTYLLPGTTIAYITNFQTPLTNSDFSMASNNNGPMLFIVDPGQSAASQPVHLVAPIDYRSLPFGSFLPRTTYFPPSNTSNIFHSMNRPSESVQTPVIGLIRQNSDQLPLKKRRYPEHSTETGQIRDGDDETSGDCSKK